MIDLHQMKPERTLDVCIGTGRGRNLMGQTALVDRFVTCFANLGIKSIAVDEPFAATNANTVCATVAERCKIPAVQLEINTRLLMSGYDEYRFLPVLDALCALAQQLDAGRQRMAQ